MIGKPPGASKEEASRDSDDSAGATYKGLGLLFPNRNCHGPIAPGNVTLAESSFIHQLQLSFYPKVVVLLLPALEMIECFGFIKTG
jgi:hypothetical protein